MLFDREQFRKDLESTIGQVMLVNGWLDNRRKIDRWEYPVNVGLCGRHMTLVFYPNGQTDWHRVCDSFVDAVYRLITFDPETTPIRVDQHLLQLI